VIARTIKGAHGGLAQPACRLGGVAEQHQRGRLIGAAGLPENLAERILGVLQHDAHELRLRVVGRGRNAFGLGGNTAAGASPRAPMRSSGFWPVTAESSRINTRPPMPPPRGRPMPPPPTPRRSSTLSLPARPCQ